MLSNTRTPKLRSVVSNVRLIDCAADDCYIDAAIFENVEVHNLKSSDILRTYGATFKHVVLRGRFGNLMLKPVEPYIRNDPEAAKVINGANQDYYRTIDWALDIRQLDCVSCEISAIPARLILRDPETQAVVRRENAIDQRWRSLEYGNTPWAYAISGMISDGDEDCVLIAGKRSRNFKAELAAIEMLRDQGIADPD